MEKEYRIVQCPGSTTQRCSQKLRLNITKEQYGKKIEVTCPTCGLTFQTKIPTPAKRPEGKAFEPIEEEDPFGILRQLNRIFGHNK